MRRLVLLLTVFVVLCTPAFADPLSDAKSAGLVGERPDGYLGIVSSSAPASVNELVNRINAERRARYNQIAARNGTPLATVEAVAGSKLVRDSPSGAWVMDASGRWLRK